MSEFLDMGGADLRPVLIAQVCQDLDRCRDSLLTGLDSPGPHRDTVSLGKTAHEVKGLAATIGAVELADLARQVEDACRCQDMAGLARLVPRLAQENAETCVALGSLSSAG